MDFFYSFYLLLFVSLSCCAASSLTLEQRVQKLEQNNVDIKKVFETKVKNLESKVTRLEGKVKHQEQQLHNLTEQLAATEKELSLFIILSATEKEASSVSLLKSVESSDDYRNQHTIHRTCHEARAADSSLKSGMHWIDPDGKAVGDDPIRVHCNVTTGATSVPHDSESETDVGRCTNRGCYSRKITYDASDRQMAALAELSTECHQSIKYDCVSAPLNFNKVSFSWWNDRNGTARYFWSGTNSSVQQPVCQCGIDQNCYDEFLPCNCDSVLQTQLSDSGIITDKTILPVTRLNFGRIVLLTSSGVHTLGRFECTGQAVVNGMPKSCSDLRRIGYTLSGLYSVMGTKQVESLYCDFTKLSTDSGFETWIGQVDVKSSPVYFYVQRSSAFATKNVPIPFEVTRLNVGGAMNLTAGIFTVPRPGIYFLSFSGISEGSTQINFCMYVNNDRIGSGLSVSHANTFTIQSTLHLNAGDKVSVQSFYGSAKLLENNDHYTHFTGWLLEEDLFTDNKSFATELFAKSVAIKMIN